MGNFFGRIKRILVWLNILLLITCSIFIIVGLINRNDFKKNVALGERQKSVKSYGLAFKYYKALTEKYPNNTDLMYYYSEAAFLDGKIDYMKKALLKISTLKLSSNLVEKSTILFKKIDKELTVSDELEIILEKNGDGNIYELIKDLIHYTDKFPDDYLGIFELGNTYMRSYDYVKAKDTYETILKFKKDMVPAILNLASAYRELAYFEKAKEVAESVFRYNKDSIEAYISLTRIYIDSYDDIKAVDVAKKAVALNPKNLDALAALCVATHYANYQKDSLEILSNLEKMNYFDYENLKDIVNGRILLRR